jgi:hypothetical protein
VRDGTELQALRKAAGLPLCVSLADIEHEQEAAYALDFGVRPGARVGSGAL